MSNAPIPELRSILVVDTDVKFLETLQKDPRAKEHPVKIAYDGRQAQRIIVDRDERLMGIFISPSIEQEPSWISVIRCAHYGRPATPLFLITDDRSSSRQVSDLDLRRLGIKEKLARPISYSEIVSLVAPLALSFDAKAALERARANPDAVGQLAQTSDEGFIAIRAEDFLSGSKSFFDVYVRLNSGRYIKLLQAGDSFTLDRIENYLKKGLTHFHIRKEVQEVYMSYCDHLASAVIRSEAAPIELKVSQTLNQGEEVMKHLKSQGVSEANLRYASSFVANLRELTGKLDITKNDVLGSFLANAGAYEHGAGTAMLAAVLSNTLQISTDKPVQTVGFAAMFHDLALAQMPAVCQAEDESKMNEVELRLYRSHPQLAVEALRKVHAFDSGALQAIEQHHMRLAGQGFPPRSGTTPVTRVAEIIGICDELHRLMKRSEADPSLNLYAELEQKVFPFFGTSIVQAFREAFFPKEFPSKKAA